MPNLDALRRGRRAYAARHTALGLCAHCPRQALHAGRCAYHYQRHLDRKRQAALYARMCAKTNVPPQRATVLAPAAGTGIMHVPRWPSI